MSTRGGYDIHGYAERVERYLALITASGIPDEDKKALTEFGEVLSAQGLHIGRVMRYLYHLRVCAGAIAEVTPGTSLTGADTRAITKLEAWFNVSFRFKPESQGGLHVGVSQRLRLWPARAHLSLEILVLFNDCLLLAGLVARDSTCRVLRTVW